MPKGTTIEATGKLGDFDVSSLSGDVDLSSENAGVQLQNVTGNVKIDTRKSDVIHCTNVKGSVELRGHGDDIDLSKISGQVTITGDYTGTISLHDLAKPVRVDSMRTQISAERVPGDVKLDRGSLSIENAVGPLKITARSTDITLTQFTDSLEIAAEKGDIELAPSRLPLSKMNVHTTAGHIELAVPQSAAFALSAVTNHGDIENEFGGGLNESTEGHRSKLQGAIGAGPDVTLTTDRGSITVRKAGEGDEGSPDSSGHKTKQSSSKPEDVAEAQQ